MARTVLLWPLLLLLPGCPRRDASQKADKLTIGRIEARDHSRGALRLDGLSDGRLQAHIRRHLKKSDHLVVAEGKGAYTLRVDLGLRQDLDGLSAIVTARAEHKGTLDPLALQASGLARLKGAELPPAKRRAHLMAVLDRALDDIEYQAMLAVAPEARVVRALETGKAPVDKGRLTAAVEIAAVRRVRAAVPALIRLLGHEAQDISDRAIGALVAVGDRRAVKPLTRLARFGDTARMAKVIDAIGALGGEEAKSFLEFVAVGHTDADIRNLAREALERMKRGPNRAKPETSGSDQANP